MNSEKEDAEFISELSRKLFRHQPPDQLWKTIKRDLTREQKERIKNPKTSFLFNSNFWQNNQHAPQFAFSLAILALISLIFIITMRLQAELPEKKVISENEESGMETEEYYHAIQVMETFVSDKKSIINPHVMSLNKEKLSAIDESIKSCENALQKNELNTHVREFLNQSLSQKYSTLKYLVGQIREKHNNEKS